MTHTTYLTELGATLAWSVVGHRDGWILEGWTVDGHTLVVQVMGKKGFDIYMPVTDSKSLDAMTAAIKQRVAPRT